MANHKSTLKRARQSVVRRLRNRYQMKTTRNLVKKLRETTDKKEAAEMLPKVVAMLDKLAKKNIIHNHTASNNKSNLTKLVNNL
ncbi:MAG: small subunit ribosomal protein S20 [Sphingobacteriales bacterium]|jgi:small subunit ribosomal protein S20